MSLIPVYWNDGVREFWVTLNNEQLYFAEEDEVSGESAQS